MSDPLRVLGAIWRSFGIVVSIIILTAMSFVTYGFDRWARLLVKLVELATGVEIELDNIPFNGQRVFNKPVYEADSDGVIDESKTLRCIELNCMTKSSNYEKGEQFWPLTSLTKHGLTREISSLFRFKASDFTFGPDELIAKAKTLLSEEVAFGSKKPDVLAEDFQFIFPIVGPLNKTEFCTIFGGFKINDAFPNAENNYFGFTVDPLEPNRDKTFMKSMALANDTEYNCNAETGETAYLRSTWATILIPCIRR